MRFAGAGLGGSSARAQRDASTRKKKGGEKLDEASRVDKNGSWGTRFARVTGRGMGAYSGEQGKNSGVSMNFDPTLTIQKLKFYIGT